MEASLYFKVFLVLPLSMKHLSLLWGVVAETKCPPQGQEVIFVQQKMEQTVVGYNI